MSRRKHPKTDVEKAVQYAEQQGWRVQLGGSHAWGRLYCPHSTRVGCIVSVWSTPRSPENHARHIRKAVDTCPHQRSIEAEPDEEQDP